jgi:hypothetical protein
LGSLSLDGGRMGVRVSEASVALIPLTLPLSRERRGKQLIVKEINAFVLVTSFEAWVSGDKGGK